MRYRKIINGEPVFGQGKNSFYQGIDAVAQAILTRLKLLQGEWWEDLKDGLPLWANLLTYGGVNNSDNRAAIITSRILGTKLGTISLVTGMNNVKISYDATTRKYMYTGSAQSLYGEITISSSNANTGGE